MTSNPKPQTLFDRQFISNIIARSAENETDRRKFMQRAGIAGLGVVGASTIGTAFMTGTASAADGPSDGAILNFALNLEYLEAEFYLRAVTGNGLPSNMTDGSGDRGQVSGGKQVTFKTAKIRQAAQEIADDERAHVAFLRSALGSAKVAEPTIDLDKSFKAAATAAGVPNGDQFDPFANEQNFLLGAFIFEDVGVTAYKGAAPLIDSSAYLEAAAGILSVEAYHAGQIRNRLLDLDLGAIANKISDARDSLDGPSDDDQGITMGGVANLTPTDSNALAFGRTPDAVLNIVYLTPKVATGGGFFPDGVNGEITTSGSSQMGSMPNGAPDTGGGSTSGTENKGLLAAGGAAALGAAGLAAYAAKNRKTESNETV